MRRSIGKLKLDADVAHHFDEADDRKPSRVGSQFHESRFSASFAGYALKLAKLAGLVLPLFGATSAHAICDEPRTIYEFTNVITSSLLTTVRSAWAEPGFTINYQETKTAEANASMTASVSAEAGVVFAKASTSLGVQVGTSWSKAATWSYSKTVPAGKEGRIVMYRESRGFKVTKKSLRSPCNYVVIYQATVNAPRKLGDGYIFRMQLRNPTGLDGVDENYYEEEIDLPAVEIPGSEDLHGESVARHGGLSLDSTSLDQSINNYLQSTNTVGARGTFSAVHKTFATVHPGDFLQNFSLEQYANLKSPRIFESFRSRG